MIQLHKSKGTLEVGYSSKSEYVKSENQSFVDEGNKSFHSAENKELKRANSYKFANQGNESQGSLHEISAKGSHDCLSEKKSSRSAHNYTSNHSSNWTADRRSYAELYKEGCNFELSSSSDSFEELSSELAYSSPQMRYPAGNLLHVPREEANVNIILQAHGNGLMNSYLSEQTNFFGHDLFSAISPTI